MKLEELAKETAKLDLAAFKKKYPAPALVVQLPSAAPRGPLDMQLQRKDAGPPPPSPPGKRVGFDTIHGLKDVVGNPDPQKSLGKSEVKFLKKREGTQKGEPVTVGRSEDNDVAIAQKTVSNVHAHFVREGQAWKVVDRDSSNGTFVDDEKLAKGAKAALEDGTRVGFGPNVRAKFWSPKGLFDFLALYRSGVDDL